MFASCCLLYYRVRFFTSRDVLVLGDMVLIPKIVTDKKTNTNENPNCFGLLVCNR